MFRPDLTPLELEELLSKLLNDYATKIEELSIALKEEAELKSKYSEEFSKEYIKAKLQSQEDKSKKMTDKEAEAIAIMKTSSLELAYELAKSKRRVIEEVLDHIRFELDILRSVYSFRKAELERTIDVKP